MFISLWQLSAQFTHSVNKQFGFIVKIWLTLGIMVLVDWLLESHLLSRKTLWTPLSTPVTSSRWNDFEAR